MSAIRYDTIAPNVARVDVEGSQVRVTWRCPVTGREVATSTAQMAPDASISSRVSASVKRSVASEVIYGAARALSGLLGGVAGRVLSNAAYTAAGDLNTRATAQVDYSEESRRAAVVLAFESVKSSFDWDEKAERFVAKPVQGGA